MGSATLVSTDIVKRFFAPGLSDAQDQRMCRITVAALSVLTFALALFVSQNILGALLAGLSLGTAYALIVLMTMFAPGMCRRSSATATLLATMISFAAWVVMPSEWRILPHPIYFTWIVSLATFAVVALVDRRPISG
jgi:SSS family solute:Na+ symporter